MFNRHANPTVPSVEVEEVSDESDLERVGDRISEGSIAAVVTEASQGDSNPIDKAMIWNRLLRMVLDRFLYSSSNSWDSLSSEIESRCETLGIPVHRIEYTDAIPRWRWLLSSVLGVGYLILAIGLIPFTIYALFYHRQVGVSVWAVAVLVLLAGMLLFSVIASGVYWLRENDTKPNSYTLWLTVGIILAIASVALLHSVNSGIGLFNGLHLLFGVFVTPLVLVSMVVISFIPPVTSDKAARAGYERTINVIQEMQTDETVLLILSKVSFLNQRYADYINEISENDISIDQDIASIDDLISIHNSCLTITLTYLLATLAATAGRGNLLIYMLLLIGAHIFISGSTLLLRKVMIPGFHRYFGPNTGELHRKKSKVVKQKSNVPSGVPATATATLRQRAAASLIDLLIAVPFSIGIGLLTMVGSRVIFGVNPAAVEAEQLFLIGGAVAILGYYIITEAIEHQTIGKKLLGLWVTNEMGGPISGKQAVVRNLIRPIDFILLYALGAVVIYRSNSHQRLGDRIAGTCVGREVDEE